VALGRRIASRAVRSPTSFEEWKEEALERRRAGLQTLEPISFREYAELFLANHFREKSARYFKSSYYCIHSYFMPLIGEKLVHEIDQSDIVAIRNDLRGKGHAPKSIRNCLGLLFTMFRKAIDNGFASRNPVEGVERPRNVTRTEQQPWTDEDFLFIMRNAPEDIRRAVLVLYSTGMRRGELFHLEKNDFDLMNGFVRIKSVEGKTTNTYKARIVPITDAVMKLVVQIPGPSIMGVTEKAFEHRWLYFKKTRQFERRLHELRHTFISRMLKSGVDKKTVMEWVGHETSEITDRYSHMIPERMEDYRTKVNRGVGVDENFINGSEASITPLWRPNGDHFSEPKKIPSQSEDLEGTFCSGGGIRTHDQVINSHLLCR